MPMQWPKVGVISCPLLAHRAIFHSHLKVAQCFIDFVQGSVITSNVVQNDGIVGCYLKCALKPPFSPLDISKQDQ